jgi:cytochrome P450
MAGSTTDAVPVLGFDPFSPAYHADPYSAYKRLGCQPLQRTLAGLWVTTSYELCTEALRSSDFGHPPPERSWRAEVPQRRSFLILNPPDHTRLRRLVSKAFTPRLIERLRPRIEQLVDELLRDCAGEVDLIEALAYPLPVTVISELLGVPGDDRQSFQEWTNVMLTQVLDRPDHDRVQHAWRSMWSYLEGLLADKRDRPGADLLSALLTARDDEERLDQDELLSMAFLLLVAGYVTTVNLIGNGIAALLAHPDQLKLLRDDPLLLPGAIEEFLRYDGPVNPGIMRVAAEDLEIGGRRIPKGAVVFLATAMADRDPAEFPDPDRLDVTRADNPHLGFGHGIHYCLGAPLARLEGEVAIGTVLRRLPNLALAVPRVELHWWAIGLRGPRRLPVRFTPSPAG